jgi:predicted nucleic acid-binding Zn ribbon protein
MQSFKDAPLEECPNCGGPVHRVIQPVGVIFKGSGFYVTDNKSRSSTGIPNKKKDEEAKPAAGAESSPSPVASSDKESKGG